MQAVTTRAASGAGQAGPGLVRPTVAELAATARLAMPIVIVQLGLMAMGVVDTIMVGHLSPAALAAVALGNVYFNGPMMFGQGVLLALDPVVAQAVGAQDDPAINRALRRGIVLAAVLAGLTMLAFLPAAPVLRALHQPRDVVPTAAGFVLASIPGVPAFLGFVLLRQTLQAMHRTRPVVVTIVAANVLNALLNWVLIFGHLGAPALGPVGSAWSSTIARWVMFVGVAMLGWDRLRGHFRSVPAGDPAGAHVSFAHLLRLGLPIGTTMVLEYGAFAAIALLMGLLGTVPMAGHQV
ncbi:MAG TPA: MATE family efflux transporter, partial [Longimicrobiales bacterium]